MTILPQELLFARADFISEKGTPEEIRRARECLLPNHLYRIEVIQQTGTEKVPTISKDGRTLHRIRRGAEWDDSSIIIALKGVKYWWRSELFSIFDAEAKPYDVRLMRRKTLSDIIYYKGSKIK